MLALGNIRVFFGGGVIAFSLFKHNMLSNLKLLLESTEGFLDILSFDLNRMGVLEGWDSVYKIKC